MLRPSASTVRKRPLRKSVLMASRVMPQSSAAFAVLINVSSGTSGCFFVGVVFM